MRMWAALALLLAWPSLGQEQDDWANLNRYRSQNQQLIVAGRRPEIVFIGDSITEGWQSKRPDYFDGKRVNRGIGGQTTPQMLLRFRADVIALHPRIVQIMAGTNDIAGNTGPITAAESEGNIQSMVELAQAAGIKVILASIPPASSFPWRPGLETNLAIQAINRWLRHYAAEQGLIYADYWAALQDGGGGMQAELTYDGVHPNERGYAVMQSVADAAMRQLSGN